MSASESPFPDAPGQSPAQDSPRISGYKILSRIGSGSLADVYKAIQLKLAREVALKVLLPGLASEKEHVQYLVREARAAARLSHENIVAVYDVGMSGAHCYFAMEYIEGNSLERLIRRGGAIDEKRALNMILQVARALDHAWCFKTVHRDIKPSNILINRRSVVKLCDFGFARGVLPEDEKESQGLTVGTPNYISPEQARGLGDVDIRADVYSLGATIYHAVTGVPPFSGANAAEIMAKHISEDPVPVNRRVDSLSHGTAFFVGKMMEKDPVRRYEPASLVKDLEAFFRDEFQVPAGSFSDSSLTLLTQNGKGTRSGTRTPSERKPARKRHRARRPRKRRR